MDVGAEWEQAKQNLKRTMEETVEKYDYCLFIVISPTVFHNISVD